MLIVTDGAVDVPATLFGSEMLQRVVGGIWNGEAPFTGGVEEFWTQLRKGQYPSTTPPTVSALVSAYEHPDLVIGLHVSRLLSGTVSRAEEAAARAGSGVTVIDTRSLSVGAGLLVTAVHQAAQSSNPPASIIDFARTLPERLHTFALVQEVDSLRRSDRAGLIPSGHLVRNHPLVLAIRGRVVALSQPKQRGGAIDELTKHLRRSVGTHIGAWALGHGDAGDVDVVVDYLSSTFGQPPHFYTPLGPTVGTHLGPDALVIGAITGPIDI